jgi:phage terminase large subunit
MAAQSPRRSESSTSRASSARTIQLPRYAAKLRRPSRYKVLYGGRAAGRSWTVARQLLLDASQARLRILCAREWQRSMKDSVHRLLRDQIELLALPGFTSTDTEIRHRNGSLFLFDGLRANVTKIKSLEGIDRCWVEEAERVSQRSWEVLLPTIRVPGSEVWVTFNPYLESDPTYQRFVVHPPEGAVLIRSSYRDNPWLSQELKDEIAHLRRVDPDAASHIYDGECLTHSEAQVLHGKWSVDEFEALQGWEGPYYGADWGFARDPTVLLRAWVSERVLYIDHAVYGVGVDIDKTPALFDLVPGSRQHMIRGDNSRPETISYLARAGFTITAAPKWSGSVEDGVAHLRSYDRIVIHPRCTQLESEARLWRYKTDELTGVVMPQLVDGHDHGPDALRYALAARIRPMQSAGTWGR